MQIEKKNRDPTVRNITRNALETKVESEEMENQFGVKTDTDGGIQTAAEDSDETDNADSGSIPTYHKTDISKKESDNADAEDSPDEDADSGTEKTHTPDVRTESEDTDGGTDMTPDKPDADGQPERKAKRKKAAKKLHRKQYIIADADSEGNAAVEAAQAVTGAADTIRQAGGIIHTAVKSSVSGVGKIHTMVKHGVRLGTAKDAGKVASGLCSGIRTGIANAFTQTGTSLLKKKIDKSTVTDTGTETMKQGLTELRYADNTRKFIQNTARHSINAARTVRKIPHHTKAQIQRIRKAAKKSADVIRKVIASKAGRIIAAAAGLLFLVVFLLNALTLIVVSAVTGLFSWIYPKGDSSEPAAKKNIRTYLSQISKIETEKQQEIDRIVNGLSAEYRYDGTQITGLTRFGSPKLKPYDDAAVLAVLAAKKYSSKKDISSEDFQFTDAEIRAAVEYFFIFDYHYEYAHCPDCNCAKNTDLQLSLADEDFEIKETLYDSEDESYAVTMSGSACEYASSLLTRLEVYTKSGSRIGGECYTEVMDGAWTVTYLIGADAYSKINWERFYLNADIEYCGNPNHCYLYGEVKNLNEAAVFAKASLTEDEKKLVEVYTEQIKAIGG